ncbi:hypothetical protein ABH926_005058 [Catenulispora sp. GP43]|uniref:DUF2742 domain-containing protein n=1 Tax=Catenulispora sp. GP43 TaxID=3156263 RepID=UPI0035137472
MTDAANEVSADLLDRVAEPPCPWPDPWADAVVSGTLAWLDRQVSGALALTAGTLVPAVGTPGWLALPDTSPAKLAAILRAARAWFIEGTELPHRLWTDLAELRAARAQAAEEAFDDFGATVLRLRDGLAGRPTYAELQQARTTYARPALTPEQIQAQTRASWAAFERRHRPAADGGDQAGREAA